MKKSNLLLLLLLVLALSGCDTELEQTQPEIHPQAEIDANQDVINRHGQVEGLQHLDDFMDKKRSSQRFVSYTDEGDPIFYNLQHTEDNRIQVRYDTTQDAYGTGEVIDYSCTELQQSDTDKSLSYSLVQCDNTNASEVLIQIDYHLKQQDTFDFRLEYGVNKENVIDTEEKQITRVLDSGESYTASNVHLNIKTRTQIYKEMVKHGALYSGSEESAECNQKPHEGYSLTVKFGNKTYEHAWNECDKNQQILTMLSDKIAELIESYYESNVTLGEVSVHEPSALQQTEQLLLSTMKKEYWRGEIVTYHMANRSSKYTLFYGEYIFIEKNTDQGWREAHVNANFHDPGYSLHQDGESTMDAYQTVKLPPGEYRLIKKTQIYEPGNFENKKDLVLISNPFIVK
ncbi:DUF4362 domain-containing protein [Neobacillus mesonae]|nr:DUF4362 domain-containing protein [Neobacillus mesonae]